MSTTAQQIADIMKVSVNHMTPELEVLAFLTSCRETGTTFGIEWFIDGVGLQPWEIAMALKAGVQQLLNRASEVRALAAAKGYLLPDDPVPPLQEFNAVRGYYDLLPITNDEATEFAEAAIKLCRVALAYDAGTVTFDHAGPSWQVENFELSADGLTPQSGDPLIDILGYQPNADFVKRKRALDTLARLDFSKRKPYMLFTADVVKGGRREPGTIICWSKMREAAGYNIHKRDVFAMVDYTSMSLSNEYLTEQLATLMRTDSFRQALSFYDWLSADDVCAFVDPQTPPNTLFSYEIQGVQRRAPSTPFIFQGESRALYLPQAQIAQLTAIVNHDSTFANNGTVSPYPALAQVVYGDSSLGWILAGYNLEAARRRGDNQEQIRSFSFIGTTLDGMLADLTAGRVVAPNNVNDAQLRVNEAIAAYGVSQTIISVLDGTGVTMFVAGKDDLAGFQPTVQALERATGGLSRIVAAIDPESATLDPTLLVTAQTAVVADRYTPSQVTATPSLDISDVHRRIDLTTYVGMGQLMQLIRTVYDFQPGALD